jgi:hypothetical protein
MIKYFYLDKKFFHPNLLQNIDHCQFIFNLLSFLKRGTFNLVVKKDFYDCFLENKNNISNNILRIRIEKLIKNHLRKKIRFIKSEFENSDPYIELIKYDAFDKFLEIDKNDNKKNSIFFDSLSFDLYKDEAFDFLEQGKLFNTMSELDFEKLLLGASVFEATVFNFIDKIFSPKKKENKSWDFERFLSNPLNLFERLIIGHSINYICEKIIKARSNDSNFLETTNSIIFNINCRSTKEESFYYNFKHKFYEFLSDYLNKELLNFVSIKKFFDIGGLINLNIYPQFAADGYATLDGEETHDRYIKSENGVFSISKDLDIHSTVIKFGIISNNLSDFRSGTRSYPFLTNLEVKKKPIRIKFSSESHPFISMGFPSNPPCSTNLNQFLG